MIIRCKKCKKICGDIKSRPAIEQYLAGNYGIVCENCGEENREEEEEEEEEDFFTEIEKIEESIKKEIEKKANLNEIIDKIYIRYRNIPIETLTEETKYFLNKMEILNEIYKK